MDRSAERLKIERIDRIGQFIVRENSEELAQGPGHSRAGRVQCIRPECPVPWILRREHTPEKS